MDSCSGALKVCQGSGLRGAQGLGVSAAHTPLEGSHAPPGVNVQKWGPSHSKCQYLGGFLGEERLWAHMPGWCPSRPPSLTQQPLALHLSFSLVRLATAVDMEQTQARGVQWVPGRPCVPDRWQNLLRPFCSGSLGAGECGGMF